MSESKAVTLLEATASKRFRNQKVSSGTRMETTDQTSSTHPPPEDSEPAAQIQDEIKELMSLLPRQIWYGSSYLYKYRGFWLGPHQLPGLLASQNQFEAEENDVLLVSTPKSGTIWLKALMFALINRKIYPIDQNHPLFNQNPHALVPFLELAPTFRSSSSSSRLLSTHLPLVLLPESVLRPPGCKIVYLCRNLKDLFVSYWQFSKKMAGADSDTSMEELFGMFCEGISHSGPVWDHVLDYWKESLEKPEKVMFLRYEDVKEEPELQLKSLAEFTGCPISAEEDERGLVEEILRLCSFENLSNLEVNKKEKWWIVDNHKFFRKGEVGDWKNHLTEEMAERLDQITAQKFHGSGLKL